MSLKERLRRVRDSLYAAKLEYAATLSAKSAWGMNRLSAAERRLERLIASLRRERRAA